ncbi:aconitate hydratase [Babesia caballi]|uniref:Aconitate hydratase n=1 Tax=Babesia caballi TaxID=5871 RepID=A0AAV4LQP8_BABCB|nr:aconitate hydratase [Babesia caballi]
MRSQTTRCIRACCICHFDCLTSNVETVHGRDGLLGLRSPLELEESLTKGKTGVRIAENLDVNYGAKGRKHLLNFDLSDGREGPGEPSDLNGEGRVGNLHRLLLNELGSPRSAVLLSLRGLDTNTLTVKLKPVHGEGLDDRLLRVKLDVGHPLGPAGSGVSDALHVAHLASIVAEGLVYLALVGVEVEVDDENGQVLPLRLLDFALPALLLLEAGTVRRIKRRLLHATLARSLLAAAVAPGRGAALSPVGPAGASP